MTPKNNNDVKTDLRHDSMEYSAATDGDDKLDAEYSILSCRKSVFTSLLFLGSMLFNFLA